MDNTKTDLLQTIQNTVAKEFNYKDYDNFLLMDDKPKTSVHFFIGEVCKRYAFEVAKASLKKASEKARLKTTFKDQVIQSDFARLQSGAQVSVDKESINSVINISL